MKIDNKGVTRLVLILRRMVVKVPSINKGWTNFIRGILSNIDERDTWNYNSGKYDRGTSHLLCPVLSCSFGGWVLVMKKAQTLSEAQWNSIEVDISEHKRNFPGDDTISNYGLLNGVVVKIDYGGLDIWGVDYKKNKQ